MHIGVAGLPQLAPNRYNEVIGRSELLNVVLLPARS